MWVAALAAALLPAGAVAQAPAPPAASRFLPPLLVRHYPATYPEAARRAGLAGVVTLELLVNELGRVDDVKVLKATGHGFADRAAPAARGHGAGLGPDSMRPLIEAAALAARHLGFFPGLADGVPVKVRVTYAYRFAGVRAPGAAPAATPAATQPASAPGRSPASRPAASRPARPPASQPAVAPVPPVRLRGQVRERGTKAPIAEALVEVRPAHGGPPVTVAADDDGAYAVRGLAAGTYRVAVTASDCRRLEVTETIGAREAAVVDYYLETLRPRRRFETVISGRAPPEEVRRHVLETEEIVHIPGTGGDALRSIENMPGVARAPFNSGQLVILGSGPMDSLVSLEGHYIPQLYHFGGLTSIINSDLIARIDFVPSNFGVRYGNATGGLIDVGIRDPKTDRLHAYVRSSIPIDTTVLVEGPVGRGGFAVSARRSYVDAFLPLVIPKDAGLSMTAAPVYWDYQGIFTYPVGGGKLRLFAYGSDDQLSFVLKNPQDIDPKVRGDISTHLAFHRLAPSYRVTRGAWDVLASAQLGYQQQDFNLGPEIFLRWKTLDLEGRVEAERRLGPGLRLKLGVQPWGGCAWVRVQSPRPPAPSGDQQIDFSETLSREVNDCYWSGAAYVQLEAELSRRVTLTPGVRVEYFNPTYGVDPRLVMRVKIDGATTVKAGAGLFHQMPPFIQGDPIFGNGDLYQQTAYHFSAGVERTLRRGLTVAGTAFFKWLTDLAVSSTLYYEKDGRPFPEVFNNDGVGRVYGLEVLLRQQPVGRFFGWLSYTVLKSERRDGAGLAWYPYDYDQTHILTLVGSVKLGRGWEAGLRFRYVTGNPWKVLRGGIYDADSDTYRQLTPRPTVHERLPAYHQLDLRIDKKFVFQRWILTAFLDVQNVYNQYNVEQSGWNFDFTKRTQVTGLPIIPAIGLKGEY